MRIDARLILTSMVGLATISALLTGCDDSAARQRAEVQDAIQAASREISAISPASLDPQSDDFDATRAALKRQVSTLQGLSGGTPGQDEGRKRLVATTLRTTAEMTLAEVASMQAQHDHAQRVLASQVRAAMRLGATADAMQQIELSAQHDNLEEVRTAASAIISQFSSRMAELDLPISEREEANRQDSTDATQLRENANDLRREARELGFSEGFQKLQQAVQLERQADQKEYDIAQRELDLELEYGPEHALAEARVNQIQALITATEATDRELVELRQQLQNSAEQTREVIGQLRQAVDRAWPALMTQSETIAQLNADAVADLNKAASQAARNDKMLQARIYALLGRAHWEKAQLLAGKQLLLTQLVSAGDLLGGTAPYRQQLQATQGAQQQAVEETGVAYQNALSALEQVRDRNVETEKQALRTSLQTTVSMINGTPLPDTSATTTMAAPMDTVGGDESAEAFVARMQQADAREAADLVIPLDMVTGLDNGTRLFFQAANLFQERMLKLDEALGRRFNKSFMDVPGMATAMPQGGLDSSHFVTAQLVSVDGDEGIIQYTNPQIGNQNLPITRVNGRWYVGSTDNYLLDGIPEAMLPPDNKFGALTAALSRMNYVMEQLTNDVDSGRISSFDEFMAQFGQRMMDMQ
jgi:hypothetical protein